MRPTNTVNNEQQDVRGISVITPLPTGEGMGEGPVVAVGWASLFGCCWSTRVAVAGPLVWLWLVLLCLKK